MAQEAAGTKKLTAKRGDATAVVAKTRHRNVDRETVGNPPRLLQSSVAKKFPAGDNTAAVAAKLCHEEVDRESHGRASTVIPWALPGLTG